MSDIDSLSTRPSLLLRIRDPRDTASWHAFTEVYAPLISLYGRRKGLQDADAADLSQDVLTEVAHCVRSLEYRPERGRFREWLGTVSYRRLSRFFEKRGHHTHAGNDKATATTAGQPDMEGIDPEWTDEFNSIASVYVAKARVLKRLEEEVRILADDVAHLVLLG